MGLSRRMKAVLKAVVVRFPFLNRLRRVLGLGSSQGGGDFPGRARLGQDSLALACDRLNRFPLFRPSDYLKRNSDLSGNDVTRHAIQHGFFESRVVFEPLRIGKSFGLIPDPLPETIFTPVGNPQSVAPIGVYVNSRGNLFMKDLASMLVSSLVAAGFNAELLSEESSVESRKPIRLFVAPHEFFILGEGVKWNREDIITSSFMYGTEQVQTKWFGASLPFILGSKGVADINVVTSHFFKEAGLPSMFCEPGVLPEPQLSPQELDHPLIRVLPVSARRPFDVNTPYADRPIDISFQGTESPRRESFLASSASFFSDLQCFIYYRRLVSGPMVSKNGEGDLFRVSNHVSGHSKILLNIHQSEYTYFEWLRIVRQGMNLGALVVSEHCLPHPHFKPGEHFFTENLRHLTNLAEWLLMTEDGRMRAEAVRMTGMKAAVEWNSLQRIGAQLGAFLAANS